MTDIESLSASLVREYLSRKGLKRSLRVLDDEFPREEDSIRNRVILAKELKIEKLLRLNKEIETPLRTMIEVMVKFFVNEKPTKGTDRVEKKERSKTRKSSDIGKGMTEHSLSIEQQFDAALRISDEIATEKARKSSDKKTVQNSESLDIAIGTALRPSKSLDHVGPNDETDGFSIPRNRGSLKPLSEGKSMKKIRGSSTIQNTADSSRKQKSNKSINLSGNSDLFPTEDLNSGYRKKEQQKVPENNRIDRRENSPTEKKISSALEFEDKRKRESKASKTEKKVSDILVFDDIDSDLSDDTDDVRIGQPTNNLISQLHECATSITLELATGLKSLIFGSVSKSFNSEWKRQSFSFCDLPDLEYGIVQVKGGPCGVLAAVQATVLKFLMFTKDNQRAELRRPPDPSSKERTNALIDSIAEILWRAGARKSASVVVSAIKEKFVGGGRYKSDGITETLTIYDFKEPDNLKAFISQNINQFESESSSGCILFLYSLVFSRTIKRIKAEMDEPSGTLIGAHGYCTQELVNLCLTGKAVSNVFDGIMELDSGGDDKSILKGIEKQSEIGLLSLFEHYESCKVGENYKSPKYPIWVVCSESHFSTLFSTNERLLNDRKHQRRFDLYYYDGLARQDEEIRLSIDTRDTFNMDHDDLIPPLEHCIRTKWKNAVVDWNNTEPIL